MRSLPQDASTIRAAWLSGRWTCAAIVAAYLRRIGVRDGDLHSIIAIDATAMAQARRLDRRPQAGRGGLALPCVPLLVKDNIDVAGLPTTAGSLALARNVALTDAEAVARLKRAGAVVIAKTNMSEFAFNYRGRSSLRGQTVSPFDPTESAGGSSSGNGAALAAGLGVLALGTDTSGSLRVPAALTGTIGLRPTFGRLSMAGVLPLSPSQDVIGPMCRRAADCATALSALAPTSWHCAAGVRGLRVTVLVDLMARDTPTARAVAEALAQLQALGARVRWSSLRDQAVLVGRDPPPGQKPTFASRSAFDFPDVMDRYLLTRRDVPASTSGLRDRMAADRRTDPTAMADVERFLANRIGASTDPRHWINGAFRDGFVRSRIAEAFDCGRSPATCADVLIYPSVQAPNAPAQDGPDTAGTHRLAAYSGYPAVAFPIGFVATARGERPVSLELMGRPGTDRRLLDIVGAWTDRLRSAATGRNP